MKQKLTSRKLWFAIVGVLVGVMTIVEGDTTNGLATAIISIVSYLVAEGGVDIARIISTAKTINDVVEKVEEGLETGKEN